MAGEIGAQHAAENLLGGAGGRAVIVGEIEMRDAEIEGAARIARPVSKRRRRRNSATGRARSPAGRARSGRSADRACARHSARIGDIGLGKSHAQWARPVAQSAAELVLTLTIWRSPSARTLCRNSDTEPDCRASGRSPIRRSCAIDSRAGHPVRHAARERRRQAGPDQPRPQSRLGHTAASEQRRGGEHGEKFEAGAHGLLAIVPRAVPQ